MQNETIKKARENLINLPYGKFDLIETIFPIEILLHSRPRQLRKLIAEKLELSPKNIHYKTFMSWLYRFRSKNNPGKRLPIRLADSMTDREIKQKGEKNWQAFEVSNPSTQEPSDESLLNYPEYD